MDSSRKSLPLTLSQETKELTSSTLGKEKKRVRELIKAIERIHGKKKSYSIVQRYLHSIDAKPFHQTTVPNLTEKNIEDRLWFT